MSHLLAIYPIGVRRSRDGDATLGGKPRPPLLRWILLILRSMLSPFYRASRFWNAFLS